MPYGHDSGSKMVVESQTGREVRKTWPGRKDDRWLWPWQQTGESYREVACANLRPGNTFCSLRDNAVPLS